MTHLESRNISYEIIEGIDGASLSKEDLDRLVAPECGLSRGMIGCNLSHLSAYRRLIESNHDVALILEDDARVHQDVRKVLEGDLDASRFDICLLDCINRNPQMPVFFDRDDRIDLSGGFMAHRLSAGPQTLHAYLISRSAAAKRIDEFFPIREAIDTYGQMRTRLRFFAVIGRQAAWVSEHSLGSMTSKGGRLSSSPAWRGLRRHRWFHETVDWIKLTRLRHMMLARLLKAEYFIDPSRRWAAMPSGRPVIFGE